jgi:hypothetical protein
MGRQRGVTKMSNRDEIMAAAEPFIKIAAHGFELARQQGVSDEQIERGLQKIEAENLAQIDPDVMQAVMDEVRRRIGLK